MKKILCIVPVLLLALFLVGCTNPETGEPDYISMALIVVMIGVFYFVMIRPQNKQKKKEKELRANMEVGDGVTTIGGIVGRVVSIKDDTFVLESSNDRTRIRFHKGAIQEVEKLKLDE